MNLFYPVNVTQLNKKFISFTSRLRRDTYCGKKK